MKALALGVIALAGCGLIPVSAPAPEPSVKAVQILAGGGYEEAYVMRRFADGRLLVRLKDGSVWFLDPKVNCPWCWTYVDQRVYVKLEKLSATILNPEGDTAEFWNGGRMENW